MLLFFEYLCVKSNATIPKMINYTVLAEIAGLPRKTVARYMKEQAVWDEKAIIIDRALSIYINRITERKKELFELHLSPTKK